MLPMLENIEKELYSIYLKNLVNVLRYQQENSAKLIITLEKKNTIWYWIIEYISTVFIWNNQNIW